RYVLRVRDFEGTTATNGIDIGRSAAELHGGRIPKPSDALKDIGAPAINNLAPGDYFLVFSARAVDDKSVGFQMNCQLTAASGAVSGNGGSINSSTNDWKLSIQVITVSSAVTELRIRFTINTAAVDDQYWEVANIGIYQALH